MRPASVILHFSLTVLLNISGVLTTRGQYQASCTVNSYNQVAEAVSSCRSIVIDGISVPKGQTLYLPLNDDAKVVFRGNITFDYGDWSGPLVYVKGKGVTVEGATGHVLNGQGELYWDGHSDQVKLRPTFFRIQATDSIFSNINLLNCPAACTSIKGSNLSISGWKIDCSDGDSLQAQHTEGFNLLSASHVKIENSIVKNQDDCVSVKSGDNLHFTNIRCSGGLGLTLSVGVSKTSYEANVVANVTFFDVTLENTRNAIHINTIPDAGPAGLIANVTYENIKFSGVTHYGINVEQIDTPNEGIEKVPIRQLKLIDVEGTLSGEHSMPVYILCGEYGCSEWNWSGVLITGGSKPSKCNYSPSGFSC